MRPACVFAACNVLFGIATVGLVMVLATWWFSPTAGLMAGFLMSIAPMHIRYSQEVRPSSSALFFILASLAALEYYAGAAASARPLLKQVPLMHSFRDTEFAEVRYLREGQRLSMSEEICPEP